VAACRRPAAVLAAALPRLPRSIAHGVHALGAVTVALLGALWGRALTAPWGDPASAWAWLGWLIVPAALLLLLVRPATARVWPVRLLPAAYRDSAGAAVAAGLWLWTLVANVASDGAAAPLPYLPLVNPLDLGVGLALVATLLWLRASGRLAAWSLALGAAAAFVWLNAILVRSFHHYAGVPYHVDAWLASLAVQTGITLLWTAIALATMWLAATRAARLPWIVGAALLGAAVVKLLVVDLSGSGAVRIVFIGVGVLMLVIATSPCRPRRPPMLRPDRCLARVALAAVLLGATLAAAEPTLFRYSAPIAIGTAAPFVQLPLTPAVYAHSAQDELRDLRVVDARGARAPFALLAPRSTLHTSEQVREATLYPLPARPSAAGVWSSPVDVVVDGDRISVKRHGPAEPALAGRPRESAGWLIDSGERHAGEARPQSLRLRWSGPAEFTAAYRLESSDDLRQWRGAGSGQVMALQSQAGALTQPVVSLADGSGRFVRLLWAEPQVAPVLTGATVLVAERHLVAVDSARELAFAASSEPAGVRPLDVDARRSLHFDLGGALPLVDVDLAFASGTHVAPLRLQGRVRGDDPWRELGSGVFYRLERGGDVATSPAIALPVTVRFLRLVPDERAAPLAGVEARLVVHAALASLVFAAQGEAPFRLLAGSADAAAGALPVATVVPQLESERPRFAGARSVRSSPTRRWFVPPPPSAPGAAGPWLLGRADRRCRRPARWSGAGAIAGDALPPA
jgi:hypothetical protein